MSPLRDRVVLLQQALLHALEYYSLPDQVRGECKRFLGLAATVDPEDSHSVVRLDAAYTPALAEARSLVADGRLTLDEAHPLPPTEAHALTQNVAPNPYEHAITDPESRPEEPLQSRNLRRDRRMIGLM